MWNFNFANIVQQERYVNIHYSQMLSEVIKQLQSNQVLTSTCKSSEQMVTNFKTIEVIKNRNLNNKTMA